MSEEKIQLSWFDEEAQKAIEVLEPVQLTLKEEKGHLVLRDSGHGIDSYHVLYGNDGVGTAIPDIAASALYDKAAYNWLEKNFDVVDVRRDEDGPSLTILNYFPPDEENSDPIINFNTFISQEGSDMTTNFILALTEVYKREVIQLKKELDNANQAYDKEYGLSELRVLVGNLE